MDDEELLRQMLLQSMQTSDNKETSIQAENTEAINNNTANNDVLDSGAREEGEISDEEGAVTPEEEPHSTEDRTKGTNINENHTSARDNNYISIDSDEDDYSKLLKNYEKKLDPESDAKDDERRGRRGNEDWSPRARRQYNNNLNDRRRERTRRSDRGRRNYREGGYYDDRPQNPAPNPAINPAFLLQSLVNFIGNTRPMPPPGTVPPMPPAPHMPPYPHEPYPHHPELYGAGDMDVDPPSANYGSQFAPINSAQYPPPYPPPPGSYYNNYDQSYNNFHSHSNVQRPAMTPVTQPPLRLVTAVTSPQKVNPTPTVTAPSVTPVNTEVLNQHEDEDRLVIDLGELDDSSEDSSDSERSAPNDTEDWMLNISRIKQQLAEKEKRRAKNSNKPVNTASTHVTATTAVPSEDKTANDKQALVEREQPVHALAEKEQRIQRLKDAIARKERELQSKKQASSTKDEARGENSVNESEVPVESRDQRPISHKHEKRPRSQSDPHSLEPVRAVKRARVLEPEGGGHNRTRHETSAPSHMGDINTATMTVHHLHVTSLGPITVGSSTAKNSSQSRVMTLEDRARVLREKTAEEHAIISARDQRNKLSAELTSTQYDVLRSRVQLSTAERNILFLEEKLRVAREEHDKLLQIRKGQENKCHVIEEQMREIDRDMERRFHVIAEHDHVLQVNDLQLEMNQSEHAVVSPTGDATDTTPPANLGNVDSPVNANPSVIEPVRPTPTLPNKEIEIIDVDDVPSPPTSKPSSSSAVPGATPLSPSESLLRQQALNALHSPSKAERRRARRKLRQLANSGGSGTAPVIVTPAPTPDSGRPSDTSFMNEADQLIVSKVHALKTAVKSDAALVHDWSSTDTEHHAPALHRTVTLAGLDDHVVVDFTADIPHIPSEGEGADYSAVLHSLDSTDETGLCVTGSQLAVPYSSPLSVFSSYRLTTHFPPQLRTAVTWSNKINPHVVFCKYDLHGTCNDDECHAQHTRDVQLSGEELLRDLASYIEDPHKSRAENESAIAALLKQVRGTILNERLDSVIRLVNQQLQARDPKHRGIVFTPRHRTLPRKTVPQQAPRRDKRAVSSSVPRDVVQEEGEDVLVVEELQDDEQPVLHLLDSEHAQLRAHTTHERYFHAHLSNHEVEQLLQQQPHNIALWLQYSAIQLHEQLPHSLTAPLLWDQHGHWLDATTLVRDLTDSSATTPQSELTADAALHVLSRALEHNRRSVVLWYYYLRLYIPRAQSREELIRTIDQGLTFTAETTDNTNWTLWCLYIDAHVSLQDKISATERAVTQLSRDTSPELASRTSVLALLLVLQSIQLQISLGYLAQARDRLRSYIYHVTADGKLSLRRALQPRDLELAVLSYIHVLLFDHVPNLTNHVLSTDLFVITWDKARDKPALSQLTRLFKEVLEFPELQSRDQPPLALMVNHVLHALPNLDMAELAVQEYLKVYPHQSALWSVYALVASAHDKHDTVALIHEQALLAQPRAWMLWFHRAMHSLSRGTLDALLQCIADAVIGLAPAPLNQLKVTATDRQSIAVARSLFVTALQMTRDSAEHFTAFTGTLNDTASYADNVYLWLLFALFEMVTGSDEHVQHVLNQATERITDPHHRNKLWLFYFTWRSKHVTTAEQLLPAAQSFVTCQALTVHELTAWHCLELARDVSASDVAHMHVPVRVEYSAVNHVIASTLQHVTSAQQRMLFLERCTTQLPHDTYLTRALTRVQWGRALYNRAKSALLSALMRDPDDAALWLDLAHIAMLQSRVYDASHVLRSAVRVVSSARLVATVLALLALTRTTDLAEHVIDLLAHLRTRGYNMKLFEDKIFRKSAFALPRDDV